jgi:hypothetical protein
MAAQSQLDGGMPVPVQPSRRCRMHLLRPGQPFVRLPHQVANVGGLPATIPAVVQLQASGGRRAPVKQAVLGEKAG